MTSFLLKKQVRGGGAAGTNHNDHRGIPTKAAAYVSACAVAAALLVPAAAADEPGYGLNPEGIDNPADTPNRPPLAPLFEGLSSGNSGSAVLDKVVVPKLEVPLRGSSDPEVIRGLLPSTEPQFENPQYPNGMDHLPTATIDMNPTELERLRHWSGVDGRTVRQINAYSPAMGRTIPLIWVLPKDTSEPRPVLYALSGRDGGQGDQHWLNRTDMKELMSNANVNVIVPALGAYSFYADWLEENPDQGGKQQWETFLTHELPGPLEEAIGANGKRALLGMSMAGLSALNYAQHKPGFYDSVGSFSGCAQVNSATGRMALNQTMETGNGTAQQMWGDINSPTSRYNDPVLNAAKLKDQKNLYVFTATGLLSDRDLNGDQRPKGLGNWRERIVVGGSIEAVSFQCTRALQAKTSALGIDDIYYDFAPQGTHSWDNWNYALHRYFPIMAEGLGIEHGPIEVTPRVSDKVVGSAAPILAPEGQGAFSMITRILRVLWQPFAALINALIQLDLSFLGSSSGAKN